MKRLFLLLTLSLIIVYSFGHREEIYYLQGTIGGQLVGVEIDEYGENCMLRYFTPNDLYDKVMEGFIRDSSSFEFNAYVWDDEGRRQVATDSLVLREIEIDVWEGTYIFANGNTEEVQLYPIVIDSLNHPYVEVLKAAGVSPYDAMKTVAVDFDNKKKTRISKGAKIQHVVDNVSGIKGIRIVPNSRRMPDVSVLNDFLLVEHIKNILSLYSCVYMGVNGDYDVQYRVTFLNASVFSYQLISRGECYGGPEQNDVVFRNLNSVDASPLMLEELFWLDEKPMGDLSEGEYRWTQYRYKVFGPKVFGMMESLYPEKFDANTDDPCNFTQMKIWYFPDWYLTPKGLYLRGKSQLTNYRCKEKPGVLIPFAELEGFRTASWSY